MEQREIKFRIWKPEHQRMDSVRLERYFGGRGLYDQNNGCDTGIWLQYTGLKDKNGNEIYEGDIITTPTRFIHDTLDALGVVTYLGTGFTSVGFGDFAGAQYQIQYNSEILGNIYEHPHLLENAIISPLKTKEDE